MERMRIQVHTPLLVALDGGYSRHGYETKELSDEDVAKVPPWLRGELGVWIRRAWEDADSRDPSDAACLQLDTPDASMEAIVRALRREQVARRRKLADEWLRKSDDDWIEDEFISRELHRDVVQLLDLPDVATRVERVRKKIDELDRAETAGIEARKRAQAGLNAYALSIPEYARAAKEGYDVQSVALEHFVRAVASFDADAIVLETRSDSYKRCKLEERKAPNEHAFRVLDAVKTHIEQLPKPDGVEVRLGRIQRFRRGRLEKGKWGYDVPVTVVMATVTCFSVVLDRIVLFFADAEDMKRNLVAAPLVLDIDDIPF
jgi:hypothetical protein